MPIWFRPHSQSPASFKRWLDSRFNSASSQALCGDTLKPSLQVFHAANIPGDFVHIYKRLGGLKYWLLGWLTWLLKIILLRFWGPQKVGFHTCYGDGTEISEAQLNHVRDTVWKNLVFNRWEQGDVLMIDNFRVSHGRQVRLRSETRFPNTHLYSLIQVI